MGESESIQLDREDIILLLLEANERILRRDSLNGVTRLEKLLFLLERESTFEGVGDFFTFEPHNFGPFSKEVYEAIDFLNGCELIEVRERTYLSPYATSDESKLMSEISDEESVVQATEMQFALMDDGRKVSRLIRKAVARRRPADVEEIDRIIQKYGTLPLNHLIRYVYRQHPDMIAKSIHPEAQKVHQSRE